MTERDYINAQGVAEQQERELANACIDRMYEENWTLERCDAQWEEWYDLPHDERWQAMMEFCGRRFDQLET